MPYESVFQVHDDHIRIEISGERIPGNVSADTGEVVRKTMGVIAETGIKNCLIILDLTGPLSPMDAFDIVAASEAVGWQRQFRAAMVDRNAATAEDTHFTEIVAGNRAYPVRVFENEEDALNWLLA